MKDTMIETSFINVTIHITAPTPEEAYTILCETLGKDQRIDYHTDLFNTFGQDGVKGDRPTHTLFPQVA